jgi:hypothetical protein
MAVHYIAFHQHDGVVNTKRIAEDLMIPAELLAKILQRLAKFSPGSRVRSGSARCSARSRDRLAS